MNKTNLFGKFKTFFVAHKAVSISAAVIILIGGYATVKAAGGSSTTTQYVIGTVEKGTIVSSISGSGQVSASDQVDIKSQVSGNLVSLNVKEGDTVRSGQLIAQVDSRDADISLENAKISLAKLNEPVDSSTLLSAQDALVNSQQSYNDAVSNLSKTYVDGLNEVASTFVDVPGILDGLRTLYYTTGGFLSDNKTLGYPSEVRVNIISAGAEGDTANRAYNDLLPTYQAVSRSSATSTIESIISDTYDLAVKTSEAVKDTKNAVDYIKTQQLSQSTADAASAQNNLNTWSPKITSHLSNLQSIETQIASAKSSIISASRDIEQKQAALDKLNSGPDALDLKSQQLSLEQQENNYNDYFIRAPFDGVIAKLDLTKTDSVSGGTVVATIITQQQIADVSLNEVDAAKVAVGQNATLTFDAIDGLSITGKVASVDLLGTVTQGVVTYDAKIAFDTQDPRVKSGMTVNADIATGVAQDVLIVPNAAIKTSTAGSYVQVVDASVPVTGSQGAALSTAPTQQSVEVGLSDDTNTEITSGLAEGDKIVTKTITATATKTATTASAPSLFGGGATRAGGATGGAGGRTFTQ